MVLYLKKSIPLFYDPTLECSAIRLQHCVDRFPVEVVLSSLPLNPVIHDATEHLRLPVTLETDGLRVLRSFQTASVLFANTNQSTNHEQGHRLEPILGAGAQ